MSLSERMTIIIHFHQSGYRTFKDYYVRQVRVHLRKEFSALVSYTRFVQLMPQPLMVYRQGCFGHCTGISFVDSTALAICRNQRIASHKVFACIAARGKTTLDWFYSLKLHFVANDRGKLLACQLSPGNMDDRKPVPTLAKRLLGKLFGDMGYISQKLVEQFLTECNVQLLIFARSNMQGRLLQQGDVFYLLTNEEIGPLGNTGKVYKLLAASQE